MVAAAARRLASSGGLLRETKISLFSFPGAGIHGIRMMGSSSGQAPSEEEIKAFVVQAREFLDRAEQFAGQETFAALMKDLSSSMSTIAYRNGVLYPIELSNLVATFVPIRGTYVPENSKVVAVDLMKRVDALEEKVVAADLPKRVESLENGRTWESGLIFGVLAAFVGTMVYLPFSHFKLEEASQKISDRVDLLEKNVAMGKSTAAPPAGDKGESTAAPPAGDKEESTAAPPAGDKGERSALEVLSASTAENKTLLAGLSGCVVTVGVVLLYILKK